MPNMEDLINRISTEISKNDEDELWITKVDLDYAYGQMELDEETKKHCVFAFNRWKSNGILPFLKRFLRLIRSTDNIPRKNGPYTKIQITGMNRRYDNSNPRRKVGTHKAR